MAAPLKAMLAIAGLVLAATAAQAQTFPSKPVRIVVPYPAGGSVDNISRAVAPRLGAIWGQPIVIENKAGGATGIAAELVAKSAPDGYTLFATGMETFAINPFMLAKLSYNVSEFTPVSGYGLSNQILVVPADFTVQDIGGRDGPRQGQAGRTELRDHRARRLEPHQHGAVREHDRD